VVTNPPYLGTSGFGKEKEDWFRSNYPNSRSDFFAMFIERCLSLSVKQGFIAMINMQSWMFLSSYEKLRKHLVKNYEFITMAHLGPRAFDSIGGEVVSTTSFALQNTKPDNKQGAYVRLVEGKSEEEKRKLYLEALANPDCGWFFRCMTSDLNKIPGAPIAYAFSRKEIELFYYDSVSKYGTQKLGIQTGANELFLRYFHEVDCHCIDFRIMEDKAATPRKWIPINKGGEFRKWYGNKEYVIEWGNNGKNLKEYKLELLSKGLIEKKNSECWNSDYYFKKAITWSRISSGLFSCRYEPGGSIFETAAPSMFFEDDQKLLLILGLYNSAVVKRLVSIISPTLSFQSGDLKKIPIVNGLEHVRINQVLSMIELSKGDWDSYETSWDFQQLPFLGVRCQGLGVREAYAKLREQWIESTLKMQELEEENNRIFIEAYGLEDEIKPEVPLREITLTCNPYYRYGVNPEVLGVRGEVLGVREFPINEELEKRLLADTMKELISYAVGCMFGRYSLDKPGLILANQGETLDDYVVKVLGVNDLGVRGEVLGVRGSADLKPNPYKLTPSFLPDNDNVIPILEGEWFDDDIVNRFYSFLKVAFGSDHFSQNIGYIEEAIGKDIRTYFIKDFYNDHVKMYKKRPIYWLFSSPKGSFNALVYMHRYTPDTASIVLSDYLREYVFKLKNKLTELSKIEVGVDGTQKEKIKARKEIDKIEQIISELEYWERDALYPTATQKISIDLDDGVKVNYAKFSKVLKRF
jgi:hypothetical protein